MLPEANLLAHHVHDLAGDVVGQARGGLVHEQELGLGDQAAQDVHELLLAAGAGVAVPIRKVGTPRCRVETFSSVSSLSRSRAKMLISPSSAGGVIASRRESRIVRPVEALDALVRLDQSDPRDLVGAQRVEALRAASRVESDRSAGGCDAPGEQTHQGALAGAVGADEPLEAHGTKGHLLDIDHLVLVVGLRKALRFQPHHSAPFTATSGAVPEAVRARERGPSSPSRPSGRNMMMATSSTP